MACAFGATILLYNLVNHGSQLEGARVDNIRTAEVKKIEIEILAEQQNQIILRNSLTLVDDAVLTTEQSIRDNLKAIEALTQQLLEAQSAQGLDTDGIEALKTALVKLQAERDTLTLSVAEAEGNDLRTMVGEGDRQYLTGLNLGGPTYFGPARCVRQHAGRNPR